MSNTKPLYATRDFKDAGTTRTFSRGDVLKDCGPGELLNYQEAGLASETKPADEEPADDKPKPAAKPTT